MMTTVNIHSDPMATWECAKQVQASSELFRMRNACALHFREVKKNIETESLTETWNVMQIVKFLNFQVGIISLDSQDPRILEMCEGHATGRFIRSCQLIIRAVQSLLSIVLDNVPFRHCGDH